MFPKGLGADSSATLGACPEIDGGAAGMKTIEQLWPVAFHFFLCACWEAKSKILVADFATAENNIARQSTDLRRCLQ